MIYATVHDFTGTSYRVVYRYGIILVIELYILKIVYYTQHYYLSTCPLIGPLMVRIMEIILSTYLFNCRYHILSRSFVIFNRIFKRNAILITFYVHFLSLKIPARHRYWHWVRLMALVCDVRRKQTPYAFVATGLVIQRPEINIFERCLWPPQEATL